MKCLKIFFWLIGLSFIPIHAEQIIHSITYDPTMLSITNETIDGFEYSKLSYGNLNSLWNSGHPELPVDVIKLSVPYNSTNYSVELYDISYTDFQINSYVYPAQNLREISDTLEFGFTHPDNQIYSSDFFLPSSHITSISSGYLFGNNKVVSIGITPFTYNPSIGVLRLITNASIKLNYTIDNQISPIIFREDVSMMEREQKLTSQFVDNGDAVTSNSYISESLTRKINNSNNMLPTYNYCIITNRELEPSFKKIIAMKRQKGLSAGTLCIEDLIASSICNEGDINVNEYGDTISIITDSAGVVRQYLKYAVASANNPTTYVLFGGKAPYAPVRYLHTFISSDPNNTHVASDIYFSELSIPFKKYNESSVYDNEYIFYNQRIPGSSQEQIFEYNPELFIGRLLCSNKEEIYNYSDKLHKYTFKPDEMGGGYLENALFVNSHGNGMAHESSSVISVAEDLFQNVSLYEQSDSSMHPTGSEVVDWINENGVGYLSLYAHGEPQAVAVYDIYNGIKQVLSALDNNMPYSNNIVSENGNGLDCLNNEQSPFICYSISCVTMPYDNPLPYYYLTQPENHYNLGESFTLGKNYGGPAFLGNTRQGYVGLSTRLEKTFLNCIKNQNYKIGVAEAFSKYNYLYATNHIKFEHNLLGDPEFEIWTSVPMQYSALTLDRFPSSFKVNGITVNDTIAYCDNKGNIGRVSGQNGSAILSGVSHNSSIMVYSHNHVPFIFPLMLQNCEISNSQYVYASSFMVGSNIQSNIEAGNVIIKNGVCYEIDATNDVSINNGLIVESGATFNIKTPGRVTIAGGILKAGAKVKIEAGKIEIVKSFTAENGAKVEINNYIE